MKDKVNRNMKIKNSIILTLILVTGIAFNVSAQDPQKIAENLMAGNPILADYQHGARLDNDTLNLAVGLGNESPSSAFISQMAIIAWDVRTAFSWAFNETNLLIDTPQGVLPIRIAWDAIDSKKFEPIVMPVLQRGMGFNPLK
jgi:hypothetical protein